MAPGGPSEEGEGGEEKRLQGFRKRSGRVSSKELDASVMLKGRCAGWRVREREIERAIDLRLVNEGAGSRERGESGSLPLSRPPDIRSLV